MNATLTKRPVTNSFLHFERFRLNRLLSEAAKYPLVIVCAGAGYGKTSAVHDFLKEYEAITAWQQLSERDNVGARFWENYTHTLAHVKNNEPFTQAISKLGFPDTEDKLNQYFSLVHDHAKNQRRIIVLDDFHLIEDLSVLRFLERIVLDIPQGTSIFLVSRSTPQINIAGLLSKNRVFDIHENDLRFTEGELDQYFRRQEVSLQPDSMREIMQDTEGWAFALNLIARSYQKAPGYGGYLRSAMKTNIFQLIETEIWNGVSDCLKNFLIRFSLIDHLSVDLILLIAKGDKDVIAELERQSAYVRRDNYINAYLIHHLFLEFLCQKQHLLTEEEKRETYEIAGDWCNKNGFRIDALAYYEKVGDYESIVAIFFDLPTQVPLDIARYSMEIFSRTPEEAFDRVELLAVMHVRSVMCLGLWQEAFELVAYYEAKYLKLPEDDVFRNRNLGGIYYCWGIIRTLMCTVDDRYDFDKYYAKQYDCLTKSPVIPGKLANHPLGPWISLVGSAREGAPQEYIDVLTRAVHYVSHCFNGAMSGADDLAWGELKFYQGDHSAAESFIIRALNRAREFGQFEVIHRALFYTLRLAFAQGDYEKAEQALKDIKTLLNENEYSIRFITYDIALAWYYCILNLPDMVPDWLKEKFTPYGHAYFIENFGNQAKARYCYLTKNYPLLLVYMQEQKLRESILFGRVELLAMEACVHSKMKNKSEAFNVLEEAYAAALPNGIIMPFIEMGKDMRTLTASMLKETNSRIPQSWLETVNRKSATYAKRQAYVVSEYKRVNRIENEVSFSQREFEILTDLSHGLSRAEIAANCGLSVNTVKMLVNNIYTKLGAENLADFIRIAVERKIV